MSELYGEQKRGAEKGPGAEVNPDEQYIVRLVGQVVRVSVETVRIVKGLPAEYAAASQG